MKLKNYIITLGLIAFTAVGCEEALEQDPIGNSVAEEEALKTQDDIEAFLNATYDVTGSYYNGRMQLLGELLSDNLDEPLNNNEFNEVYIHNTLIFNTNVGDTYADPYIAVFRGNRILEVLEEQDFGFSQAELDRIRGEILFLRAIAHFENVRLFGQPYGYTADNSHLGIVYKENTDAETLPRPTVASNYQNIIRDLQEAESLLPPSNGVYADQYAAKGFLAKVYFQQGNYSLAAQKADEVITSGNYSLDTTSDRFRQVRTPETVFEVVSFELDDDDRIDKSSGFADNYGRTGNDEPQLSLSNEFYQTYAGDSADSRLDLIEVLNPGTPNQNIICRKFRREFFNVPVLHLTDLKLLRAEALAESGGDLNVAIQDVNDIKERAYGGNQNNLDPNASTAAVIREARYERRIEMVGEGNRIHELKRRGAIEGEDITVREDPWDCNGMVLQFPAIEETEVFPLNPAGGC